jgi:hypothetical protein
MIADLSKVYSFLMQNRIIETEPRRGHYKKGEKAVAEILTENPGLLHDLCEFLAPMGLEVQVWDETQAPGISRDGFAYFLVRTGLEDTPCFGEDRFLEMLRDGATEARDVTGVWFLHLWLLLSHLLYSSIQRSPSEIIRHTNATVTHSVLNEAIREHIETLRKEGPPGNPEGDEVHRILTDHRGMTLSRRVKRFLEAMCGAAILEEVKDEQDLYRQTLLGAIEFESMFSRTFAPYISEDNSVTASVTKIVAAEAEGELSHVVD